MSSKKTAAPKNTIVAAPVATTKIVASNANINLQVTHADVIRMHRVEAQARLEEHIAIGEAMLDDLKVACSKAEIAASEAVAADARKGEGAYQDIKRVLEKHGCDIRVSAYVISYNPESIKYSVAVSKLNDGRFAKALEFDCEMTPPAKTKTLILQRDSLHDERRELEAKLLDCRRQHAAAAHMEDKIQAGITRKILEGSDVSALTSINPNTLIALPDFGSR